MKTNTEMLRLTARFTSEVVESFKIHSLDDMKEISQIIYNALINDVKPIVNRSYKEQIKPFS